MVASRSRSSRHDAVLKSGHSLPCCPLLSLSLSLSLLFCSTVSERLLPALRRFRLFLRTFGFVRLLCSLSLCRVVPSCVCAFANPFRFMSSTDDENRLEHFSVLHFFVVPIHNWFSRAQQRPPQRRICKYACLCTRTWRCECHLPKLQWSRGPNTDCIDRSTSL